MNDETSGNMAAALLAVTDHLRLIALALTHLETDPSDGDAMRQTLGRACFVLDVIAVQLMDTGDELIH